MNDVKQNYAMKLGEGGEAFFVFETFDEIPESLQTSPVISPAASPPGLPVQDSSSTPTLQEPEFLDLAADGRSGGKPRSGSRLRPAISSERRAQSDYGESGPCVQSTEGPDWDRSGGTDSSIILS